MAIFEPGFMRAAMAYEAAGEMPPGKSSLDVYLELLGDSKLPWSVAVVSGDPWDGDVARHALEHGGHIRVGLEDYAGTRGPSNLQLVEEAVALCAEMGRPLASAAQTAKILNLPR